MAEQPVSLAKWIIAVRDARSEYFNPKLFDEDSWELLLTLYIAAEEGRTVNRAEVMQHTVTSAATLDRWIKILASEDLLTEPADDDETLCLTRNGHTRMHNLLAKTVPTPPGA
ncbi:hypothetical protein [Sphingomonas nostoxanthinifaciens]|uniref:hypothetical protein n=1 Tax=Sphingomonas nostoxanthinifaciens TaxID=2872652 RepID=UPI001CC1D18F|nr:hypothetical protein [Sphingomonas nostoxanthinifaciens]UAK22925.1 hypothetical protein K8P63_10800 [Sphingomonas nostoxanthinifaciens]